MNDGNNLVNKISFSLRLYFFLSFVLDPVYFVYQLISVLKGKENPNRFWERWVSKQIKRPSGKLIWLHAVSVGETLSLLPLIEKIAEDNPKINILITSSTKTSAQIFEKNLKKRVIHQMAPHDTFFVSKRFIKYWRPDLAVRVESEIWPRILLELKKKMVPSFLFNARFSKKSLKKIESQAVSARFIFSLFNEIHVQENKTLEKLINIGIPSENLALTGSLKDSAKKLAFDEHIMKQFLKAAAKQNIWLAACTHSGEDEIVLKAHKKIGGILLIAPRHIERGKHIAKLSRSMGFTTQLRSEVPELQKETVVYIADTMGEMGLWYSMVNVAFIGGSLVERGGHNPVEAAQLETFILHGPFTHNAEEKYYQLNSLGVGVQIENADILADELKILRSKDPNKEFKRFNPFLQQNETALITALDTIRLAI